MTGAELRTSRKRLGLTQAALGGALELSRTSIVLYEAGKAPIPRAVELAMEALALRTASMPT